MKEYIERNALRAELEYDLVEDVNIYNSRTDKEIRDDKYYFAMEVLDNAPVVEVMDVNDADYIVLYADEFNRDVWEQYCDICRVSYDSTYIKIRFNRINVETD